ncbi:hypothetical protein XELAEV_18020092mg [Xenopus laevis]|uniref:Uncharacterized protein n=1 Tax=Xenopus laevis TaxID=8355 RepID=A0A974D821_XENLA|nr:hypothetical protein XELAEV_18020092mg [Xenopus laevis]
MRTRGSVVASRFVPCWLGPALVCTQKQAYMRPVSHQKYNDRQLHLIFSICCKEKEDIELRMCACSNLWSLVCVLWGAARRSKCMT